MVLLPRSSQVSWFSLCSGQQGAGSVPGWLCPGQRQPGRAALEEAGGNEFTFWKCSQVKVALQEKCKEC